MGGRPAQIGTGRFWSGQSRVRLGRVKSDQTRSARSGRVGSGQYLYDWHGAGDGCGERGGGRRLDPLNGDLPAVQRLAQERQALLQRQAGQHDSTSVHDTSPNSTRRRRDSTSGQQFNCSTHHKIQHWTNAMHCLVKDAGQGRNLMGPPSMHSCGKTYT